MRTTRRRFPGTLPAALAAAALALIGSCRKVDPMDRAVDASTYTAYTMWANDASQSLAPEQFADFKRALQQIRFTIMAEGSASGSDAVEEELLRRVNGLTPREVIHTGLRAELRRASVERDAVMQFLERDRRAAVPIGDVKLRDELDRITEGHEERLKAANDEVSDVRTRLEADGLADPSESETP